jgi:hypothetical protein
MIRITALVLATPYIVVLCTLIIVVTHLGVSRWCSVIIMRCLFDPRESALIAVACPWIAILLINRFPSPSCSHEDRQEKETDNYDVKLFQMILPCTLLQLVYSKTFLMMPE